MTINNHGDLILYPVNKIKPPKTAKKSKVHILQESNATGNRHELFSKYPIYHWISKGIEYIYSDKYYTIRHIGGDCEHGEQPVEAGTRKVLHELEHDPFKNELRIVKD